MNRTSQPQIAQVVRSSTESTDPIADELRRVDATLAGPDRDDAPSMPMPPLTPPPAPTAPASLVLH